MAFRSREKAGAAEKEEDKKKNVLDEKTEAMTVEGTKEDPKRKRLKRLLLRWHRGQVEDH